MTRSHRRFILLACLVAGLMVPAAALAATALGLALPGAALAETGGSTPDGESPQPPPSPSPTPTPPPSGPPTIVPPPPPAPGPVDDDPDPGSDEEPEQEPVNEDTSPLPPLPPQPTSAPFTDRDYWAFADHIVARMRNSWSRTLNLYRPVLLKHNAEMLIVHALAALHNHNGPARNDERARLLVNRFLQSPPWSDGQIGLRNALWHAPGWTNQFDNPNGGMGKVIDAKAAESLAYAWHARFVLNLPPETVARLQELIKRASFADFYRYPTAVLNQINFNAELYDATASAAGDNQLMRRDYALQLRRFAREIKIPRASADVLAASAGAGKAGARAAGPGKPYRLATNLGPSYRFHYWPGVPISRRQNLDSPEYANMVIDVLRHYPLARSLGAAKLSPAHLQLFKAWVTRALSGYWTHTGYLNWDTGLGMARWHRGIFWALAQQGLLTMAGAKTFQSDPRIGPWAKWLFDRGLLFYLGLVNKEAEGKLPSSTMYGIGDVQPRVLDTWSMGARMASNAARAVHYNLGTQRGSEPPPLYSYDADIGRVAITTPTYSTAIVAVNQQAFAYGGVELARLYDRRGQIAANAGGTGDSAFGLVVRNTFGARALATQTRRGLSNENPPVVLTQSPRGKVLKQKRYPAKPDAGPFRELRTQSTTKTAALEATTRHRFTAQSIAASWTLARLAGSTAYVAETRFPSWGADARIVAVLHNGERITLAAPGQQPASVPLSQVSYVHLHGEGSGYVVIPIAPGGAVLRAIPTRPERTNPRPGHTLAVVTNMGTKVRRVELAAAFSPAYSASGAPAVAKRLRPVANRLRREVEFREAAERRRLEAERRAREEAERRRREAERRNRERGDAPRPSAAGARGR